MPLEKVSRSSLDTIHIRFSDMSSTGAYSKLTTRFHLYISLKPSQNPMTILLTNMEALNYYVSYLLEKNSLPVSVGKVLSELLPQL